MKRGFSRERHSGMKVAISGIAAAGFVGSWLAFNNGHAAPIESEAALAAAAVTATPVPATATATSRTSGSAARGTATAGATPTPTTATARPTLAPAQPRRSRGS